MSETQLVNQILDFLKFKGYFAFRVNTMGNYNPKTNSYYSNPRLTKGVPDIILVIKGKFIGIECKSAKGKQSDSQKEFQKNLEEVGGRYWLINSFEGFAMMLGLYKNPL